MQGGSKKHKKQVLWIFKRKEVKKPKERNAV